MRLHPLLGLVALAAAGVVGCESRPPALAAPAAYDAAASVNAAFAAYDANGDGTLDIGELGACPALKSAAPSLDTTGDRKVSRGELQARFDDYARGGTEAVSVVGVTVYLNDQPLPGALVTLTPEPFMGPGFAPASGTTDDKGFVEVRLDDRSRSGVPAGFYKVAVSKKDAAGKETLPARYHTPTTLGREVYEGGRATSGGFDLRLTAGR